MGSEGKSAAEAGSAETTATEVYEGYLIDLACVRKYPRSELFARARSHTVDCALMGHCVESGYGLVTEHDDLIVLDTEATPRVVAELGRAVGQAGISLRVRRELHSGEMETVDVDRA